MAKSRIRLFNQSRAQRVDTAVAHDRARLLNQLTILFMVLTLIVFICYLLVFLFPDSSINPLRPVALRPPFTLAPTSTPTITPTPSVTRHPTNTPSDTATPTDTPTPTETPLPAPTLSGTRRPGTRLPPSPTPSPRPKPTELVTPAVTQSAFNYTAEVIYQRAQLYGTNWAGIAGLVFGLDHKHQQNIDVHAWGDAPLGPQGPTLPSGISVQYGPSGWEFTLGDKPVFGKWNVQLVDPDGNPLSDVVVIEMQGDPRANLAYVIFQQNH